MFCFNFFFHFRFTLIVWEFKEVADEKNGDDNEDEEMRLISVNNVNQTIGKGPIVGSEEIKEQILARTSRECKLMFGRIMKTLP